MPNLAQQYPLLLFMPLFIFAAVAVCVGAIHLAILAEAKIEAERRAAAARPAPLPRPLPRKQPNLRLVSTRS
jgi:hypothetical protein